MKCLWAICILPNENYVSFDQYRANDTTLSNPLSALWFNEFNSFYSTYEIMLYLSFLVSLIFSIVSTKFMRVL